MNKLKVLMVDDESRMRKLVNDFLSRKNYEVIEAGDGEEAIDKFYADKDIALVILDVMMPKMDGWEVCKQIRKDSKVPIIMLTAKGEERDELQGFDCGADEYISKPFSPKILTARVDALVRRAYMVDGSECINIGGIEIDKAAHMVKIDGEEIELSFKEFELLSYFVENKGIALSREKILNNVWNYDYFGDARTIDTHVKKLRKKMGEKGDCIKTIWGMGYKFEVNSTLSEKFYFSDKQECMLNTYSKINQIMNDYDAGTVSESQMSDSIEQLTGSAAISVIVVNSDWTTVYSNINGEQDMINRLLRSIFNKDVFGTSDSALQQNSNNENAPGDMQNMANPDNNNPDKGNSDNGSPDKNNPKNKDDISINMSDSGIEENRDIITQTDLYTLQKVYDNRLGDDYYELFGTLSNGDSIMLRMALQGIKDNVSISNTFITYVGIGILIIGVIAAYIFSSYITKPIQQLSDIAERMSNLDFDVKYHGKDKSEIGVLGNSMNNMSKKLEENISQLKSANKELQRDIDRKIKMEEVRTEFLSNVSHELKTPIALIQGYAEGLKEGISDDPESMDFYCDVIIDEAGKMNNMVKKLLTLNQIEFGNEELVMERFDIIELITSIVNANELRASQKGIQIEFNQRDEQIDVWSDEYKIEEVVTNYITNAINHCDFENRIEVSVERIGDDVRVHVFNTGKNIPEEDIPNIWQKFYKVDKARTREYGGNGIGLSIVKAIMDSYGKGFGVINKSNGVEFWFDLDGKAMV